MRAFATGVTMWATLLQDRRHAVAPLVAITLAAIVAFGAPAAARTDAHAGAPFPAPEHGSADRHSAPPALPVDRAPAFSLETSTADDHGGARLFAATSAWRVAALRATYAVEPPRALHRDTRATVLTVAPKTSPPPARS